jgi:hypothetical protein
MVGRSGFRDSSWCSTRSPMPPSASCSSTANDTTNAVNPDRREMIDPIQPPRIQLRA